MVHILIALAAMVPSNHTAHKNIYTLTKHVQRARKKKSDILISILKIQKLCSKLTQVGTNKVNKIITV